MKRILIIKLGAIGDVVMTSHLITAIKNEDRGSHITWVCGMTVFPLLKMFSGIDRLITVNEVKLLKGSPAEQIFEIFSLWKKLFLEKFDFAIVPYRDKRYKVLTAFTRYKKFASFMGKDRKSSFIPGRYYGYEFVRLFTENDNSSVPEVSYPEFLPGSIPQVPFLLPGTPERRIILFPGGAKNVLQNNDLRRYPLEKYAGLAEKLTIEGFEVMLLGANSDAWAASAFDGMHIHNYIGKTTLPELISVLSQVKLLITHDTGILHLGKLTGTKTIGLFGPLQPSELMPRISNIVPLWEGKFLPCSPCYNGKSFAPCSDNKCMKNIRIESILEKIDEI